MSNLFDPLTIGELELKNRVVRSATYFGLSDEEGYISKASIDLMKELAQNEVGLIVAGFAFVQKNGQAVPDMNGIQDDDHIPSYKEMTSAVHDRDGKIVLQIVHGGGSAYFVSFREGDYIAVSVYDEMAQYNKKAREMTDEDIQEIIQSFGQAGRRVQEAGFDGVQIHGAHGYLVSQFLSPVTNRRQDKWGGDIENRMRFVVETTRAIKANVDEDFPVMIKLGVKDFVKEGPGLTIEEGALVCQTLEDEGIDLIEISNGIPMEQTTARGITKPEQEAYYSPEAAVVREAVSGPI